MTIKEMRALLGITQAAFSEKYNIPKRTIENWESGKRECPQYVHNLLERVVVEDHKSASGIEEYATNATREYTMQLDEELTEQQIIDNRFL